MQHAETALRRVHLVALEPGEPLIDAVVALCRERGIRAASVQGIGAIHEVEIGAFDRSTRAYRTTRLDGDWELLSLLGNVGVDDEGTTIVHPHVVLGDAAGRTVGGHLMAGTCAVTVELVIAELDGAIARRPDPRTGLKLWSL